MLLPAPAEILIHKSESILGANDNGRKINVWSTNIFSNELLTAVLVVFNIPSSVQSKRVNTALTYSLRADSMERGGAKGQANRKLE